MTGYVRDDTNNNIANDNIINADDLDGEFNAVVAAFDSNTGHTHDGSTAEGAPIEVVGPNQEVAVNTTSIVPSTNNTIDLGSTTKKFKDGYVEGTITVDTVVANTINANTVDATTVDGIEGSQIVLNDQDNSITGTITLTGNVNAVDGGFSGNVSAINTSLTGNLSAVDGTFSGGVTGDTGSFTTDLTLDGSTVWTSGNDGSGSGLDADLIDGLDSQAFLLRDSVDTQDVLSKVDFFDVVNMKQLVRFRGDLDLSRNVAYSLIFTGDGNGPYIETGSTGSVERVMEVNPNTAEVSFPNTSTGKLAVGTVFQSGGVPTGGIIERGSNASGEYIKYADGTLTCWGTGATNGGSDVSIGFPEGFSSAPEVFATPKTSVGSLVGTVVRNLTTNGSFQIAGYNTSGRIAITIAWFAIGRWY